MFKLEPPKDDGLLISKVGEWSKDKHYYLMRYIDAFTSAMKNKGWAGLHYIDLFAGAGIECLAKSKRLEWGSPLIAAKAPYPFTRLHLCEIKSDKYEALAIRVKKFCPDAQIIHGDANEKVHEILKEIPRNTLSLAFLDPFGLHLDYETLRSLADKRSDLIIFFPDHLDASRNWLKYYWDNPNSNLDACLGQGANWRDELSNCPPDRYVDKFRDIYINQLSKLGYTEFGEARINMTNNRPLYRLIFCSKSSIASKIWCGISSKKPNGQRTFDFGPK